MLRNFGPGHEQKFPNLAHLIDVNAEIRAGADEAVRVRGRQTVIRDEPVHEVGRGRLHGDFQRPRGYTATIESGFSMRIHGGRLPLTTSSFRRTTAVVSAAVPVNSVSPWLAWTSPR